MIYDKIENIDLYNIDKSAVEFIKNLTGDEECKRYEISDKIYANIEEYRTKECGYFEAHQKYADIQLLLTGEETIEYTSLDGLEIKDAYNAERDIAFFYDGTNPVIKLPLKKGFFALLNPEEAHKPQLISSASCKVKKVVVKIAKNRY